MHHNIDKKDQITSRGLQNVTFTVNSILDKSFIHTISAATHITTEYSLCPFCQGLPKPLSTAMWVDHAYEKSIFYYFSLDFSYDTNHYADIQSSNMLNKVCGWTMYKISIKTIYRTLWVFSALFYNSVWLWVGLYYCSLLDNWFSQFSLSASTDTRDITYWPQYNQLCQNETLFPFYANLCN